MYIPRDVLTGMDGRGRAGARERLSVRGGGGGASSSVSSGTEEYMLSSILGSFWNENRD